MAAEWLLSAVIITIATPTSVTLTGSTNVGHGLVNMARRPNA
jgi:hypothetical protein